MATINPSQIQGDSYRATQEFFSSFLSPLDYGRIDCSGAVLNTVQCCALKFIVPG